MQGPRSNLESTRGVLKRQIWLVAGLAVALAVMLFIDWQLWDADLIRRTFWSKEFVVFALLGAPVASAVLVFVVTNRLPAVIGVPVVFIWLMTIPLWLYCAAMTRIWWGFSVAG
jgi:hypothetical protein